MRRWSPLAALTALALVASTGAGTAAPKQHPKAVVEIIAPTSAAPAEVPQGSTFRLRFTTDQPGAVSVYYRGTDDAGYTAFPDSGPRARRGERRMVLAAPANAGVYDLKVRVTTNHGRVSGDTELDALYVVAPGQPATVAITSPTTDAAASAQEGATFPLTFTTDEAGSYVLSHRHAGAASFTAFGDAGATGNVEAGSSTVTLTAPTPDGTYDLRLDFVDLDSKPSSAEEIDALSVTELPGSRPADVALTAPTSSSPAIVTQGAPVRVAFTTDLPGSFSVEYRASNPISADNFTPLAGGTGDTAAPGTVALGVRAPAAPGAYDLRVVFTTTQGLVSTASADHGLVVLVPGVTEDQRCDPIDPAHCLLPFPNDHFTASDPATATGRRVNLNVLSTPRNAAGKPVMPTEWNRQDGFSPGTPLLTYVAGIDLHQTWGTADRDHFGGINQTGYFDHRDQITDPALSTVADSPMVIINARTGERHPFWSELDTHPETTDERRLLIIRPTVNFAEGERYIVALRNLKRGDGTTIPAGASFAAFRDGTATLTDPLIAARRAEMEDIFARLGAAGVARGELFLAWDFTIASERNLSERVLHMRDEAFAELGDRSLGDGIVQGNAPEFVVDGTPTIQDDGVHGKFRRIKGRVKVPNYLDHPQQITTDGKPVGGILANEGATGSRLYYEPREDELPDVNPAQPTVWASFTCDVPLDRGPSYATLEGHGLLGTQSQVGDGKWPRRHGFAICAADWWGMSTEDVPNVVTIIADFSNFQTLPDRAQQGFLNFMFLGRAAVHPQGFASHPAFQQNSDATTPGPSLLRTADGDETHLYYDGNSQGGIMGGSLIALSPDIRRGILGVTAMNYSTLLQRSVDWEDLYAIPFYANYRDPADRQLVFAMMQMLWDRGEANGFAHHMTTDPLADTPPHEVMLQVAWSDHQVTNHAAEVEARTIGAPVMVPGLPDGRHWERQPYDVGSASYPYNGSALIYWDSGNVMPPNGNNPADDAGGGDPHSHPRNDVAGGWQEAHFLLTGEMVDVCGGQPYLTSQHPSPVVCAAPSIAPGPVPVPVPR